MDNSGEKGKGHQGTCIKNAWTKPEAGRIEGGRWGWGRVRGGEMETTVLEQKLKKNINVLKISSILPLHGSHTQCYGSIFVRCAFFYIF